MRALLRRVARLESPQRDRGAAFMAVLRAMNADESETQEAMAELESAAEAFHEACGGKPERHG